MVRSDRPSIDVDAARASRHPVAELFGRDLPVMLIADVACVLVRIAATMSERYDVIDDGGCARPALGEAQLAKAVGPSKATLALALASTAAKPLDH